MASTALANLAKGTRGPNQGKYIGSPNVIYLAKPKGLRNIRKNGTVLTPIRRGPGDSRPLGSRGVGGVQSGYVKTGAEFLNKNKIRQAPPSKIKGIPQLKFNFKTQTSREGNIFPKLGRAQGVKDFARSANLTAGANAAKILNKIANYLNLPSGLNPQYSKGSILKGYGVIAVGGAAGAALGLGAVKAGRQLTPGGRAVTAHKKKVKIAKKNGKAALKAQKMNEKQKLRSSKAVKPMKGASGRGAPTGKKGQSGGGRKNFRPRRDGNGKFAGSY